MVEKEAAKKCSLLKQVVSSNGGEGWGVVPFAVGEFQVGFALEQQ